MAGKNKVGALAPEFSLQDHSGRTLTLSETCAAGPILLVFYPGDFTPVCTKQLCSYGDNMAAFKELGVQIVGVSKDSSKSHAEFAERFGFSFRLLSDPGHRVARAFGCSSMFMLGGVSRACIVIARDRTIRYQHVEPTVLTHRSAAELLGAINDLRARKLL